ncbi:YjgN family protein [Flavobacterium sp. RSSA_27]|uniref:YjgN family protein n=1 Tax=Flavobacterium sp. RSSA_27 TaxID=3447667 RepID=UPI003F3BBA98
MEETTNRPQKYHLSYTGKGSDFFSVIMVNWLFTLLTLGFYYPWAKAKQLNYLYGETHLNGDPFTFHGTGKEMFKGFIKALLIFGTLYGMLYLLMYLEEPFVGLIVFYLGILAILPIAIHGSYRYRMSRTSWRGIRFGYRGERKEFTLNFFKWILLTLVTFGIYSSWMTINMRRYLIGNIRFGDAECSYNGEGTDYLILNIKGYFLTIFTLGIYMFWWQKDLFEYYISNLSLHKDEKELQLTSTATGSDFFTLGITNLLILIFTLGLGYAWVVTRTLKYIFDHIEIEGTIDLDSLKQTEENFKDATGEDVSDFLDLDFII